MLRPSLKELEAFCAVVEAGGINAAARRLSLSRSVVSKRITDLEASVGAVLMRRSTSQSTLTEAGERFYERAQAILLELEDAVNTTRGTGDGLSGSLRVTIPADAAGTFLQQPLLEFAQAHPRLRMFVDVDNRAVDLSAGGYDLAIRIGRLGDSALRARKLCDSPRVVCAAPGYLERRGTPRSLDDLVDHDTIGYGNSTISCIWRFEDTAGGEDSVRVTPRLTFTNGKAMCAAAVAGMGITVLPDFIVADAIASGALQRLDLGNTPLPDTVYAVYPGGRPAPLKVRAFIDFMADALKR